MRRLSQFVRLTLEGEESFDKSIQLALQAILTSPHFLFRVEVDPEAVEGAPSRLVNDYELATRLSYFLWSSMPDDELFTLARRETLRKDGELEKQVRRMLADSKSQALVDNFAEQWLQIRNLKNL